MHITSLKLRTEDYGNQWAEQIEDRWEYADNLKDERWRKGWISFDCLCHEPASGTLYAGENDNPFRSSYLWEVTF